MSLARVALPIILGVSLCGVTATVLYLLLKKDDDEVDGNAGTNIKSQRTVVVERAIPNNLIGAFIGRGGANIKLIEEKSAASVNLSSGNINEKNAPRTITIRGPVGPVKIATEMVDDFLNNQPVLDEKIVVIPQWACGRIIGIGGKNIHEICHTSGAKVTVDSSNRGDTNPHSQRNITIKGTKEQILIANEMIQKCVYLEKCSRETNMAGRSPRGPVPFSSSSPAPSDSSTGSQPVQSPISETGTGGGVNTHARPNSGACLEVVVSAVSSPSKFWLQLCGSQTDKLDVLVDQMTDYYSKKDNQDLHELPDVQEGQIVAAVFRHDGRWYRAQVMEIKKNEFDPSQLVADVLFVDYGDCEYVAIRELKELRTDMLRLKFQAIECFLAGVAPIGPDTIGHITEHHIDKWHPKATEMFVELTQAARWKKLLSRTCLFRERALMSGASVCGGIASVGRSRISGDDSVVPGVKLYDILEDGTEMDIGAQLVKEGWAVEIDDKQEQQSKPCTPPSSPITPHAPNTPFGDLEVSKVLGMLIDRDERSTSLPKQGPGESTHPGDRISAIQTDSKTKSSSLASVHDDSAQHAPKFSSHADLTYPSSSSHKSGNGSSHNGHESFVEAERASGHDFTPLHRVDSKDDSKAKVSRIHSNHNLHGMGREG